MEKIDFNNEDGHILLAKNIQAFKHIAIVKLNRPKSLNALSHELIEELCLKLQDLDKDPETRVIIITGNEKAFAAGADLNELADSSAVELLFHQRAQHVKALNQMKTPTIAAVSGLALGGGLELAMTCDMILAADNARFGQPEIKVGTIPGAGGTQRLTQAIGKSKAMHLCLTGEMIDAQKAYEWNLISAIYPTKTLLHEALLLAKKIANHSPIASRLASEAIRKSFEMPLSEGMDFERRNFYLSFSSNDQKEGMRAFLEKRKPNYKGI